MQQHVEKLSLTNGNFLSYHRYTYPENTIGIIFLGGFMSDMNGTKAMHLDQFCRQHRYDFIRFDYSGHGQSSMSFSECTIGLWKENILTIIDQLTEKPQLLIGSSMGGWLMLLTALARKARICGLIGVASAPDFTENLIWNELSKEQQQVLQTTGLFSLESEYNDSPYPISYPLITEGRNHLLLNQPISIDLPTYLIHGMKDIDVPYQLSQTLHQQLTSKDKHLILLEHGDHRMSSPEALMCLTDTLQTLYKTCQTRVKSL